MGDNGRIGRFSFVRNWDATKIHSQKRADLPLTQEDPRSKIYGHYRKEAEEYDKEFMKKYEEDLDTTLIFVSSVSPSDVGMLTRSQAGLFSAVTSAFILDVQSQLQPDTGDETVALLRVLIDTTFGNDAPTLPQWAGPPHAIVQVQQSSTPVSPLHFFPPSSRCSASSG